MLVCLAKQMYEKSEREEREGVVVVVVVAHHRRATRRCRRRAPFGGPPQVQCRTQECVPRQDHQRWSQPGHSKSDFGGGGVGIGEGFRRAAGGAAMMEAFLGRPFREDAYFERLGVPVSS